MDTRKRNLAYSGDEAMQESKKMAARFEKKMYTAAATSQSDYYAPDIALKIQTVNIKSENFMSDTIQSNSAAYGSNLSYPASLDPASQTGNLNNGDWQDEMYQKILAMRGLYLSDLNKLHQKMLAKFQQIDSLPYQPNKQVEKLRQMNKIMEYFIQFLQTPKHAILTTSYTDKVDFFEKHIVYFINFPRQKPAPEQQYELLATGIEELHIA